MVTVFVSFILSVAGNFHWCIVYYVMIHAGASPRPFFGTRSSNSIDIFVSLILKLITFYLFVRMIVVKIDFFVSLILESIMFCLFVRTIVVKFDRAHSRSTRLSSTRWTWIFSLIFFNIISHGMYTYDTILIKIHEHYYIITLIKARILASILTFVYQ